MKYIKLFEDFYFHEEEEKSCPSCGCEECECTKEDTITVPSEEQDYNEFGGEMEPNYMDDVYGEEEEEIEMPYGEEEMTNSPVRRIKSFDSMEEEGPSAWPTEEEEEEETFESKKAKPDFLDLDKDGNKKESMKKAAADKKKGDKKEEKKDDKKSSKKGGLSKAQEKLPEGLKKAIRAGVRD